MRTKVVHLTSVHSAFDVRIFRKECKTLAAAGYDVTFVAPHDGDEQRDGVKIRAVQKARNRCDRMTRTVLSVYRAALREEGDIYHFHDPELMPVALLLRAHGKRVVYDVHEDVPQQILTKSYIPYLLRRSVAACYGCLEWLAGNKLSAIVTANEDISERFLHISSPVVALHNYADLDEFCCASDPAIAESRYRSGLVFHSSGSERTSLSVVLRALDLLPKDLPMKLLVTANKPSEAQAAAQIFSSRPNLRVHMLGVLSRLEMATQLSSSAVSLVLYNEPQNHSSIRSNRFFESLAAAAPVVAPDFPEWRQTIESIGCGLVVNPTDPGAIAGALEYLLTHTTEAGEMGKRGREALVNTFNWGQEKDRLLELYSRLTQ